MTFGIHIGPNIRQSPYYAATLAEGVRAFSVYNHMYIPGHFGDPQAEYDRLIRGVAMWDVAAQRQVEVTGPHAGRLVQWLVTRDISGMKVGQGRYVCLCDTEGFVINDPVLLKRSDTCYWLSIADSDIALWAQAFGAALGLEAHVGEADASPLAIQGPKAAEVAAALFGDWVLELRYFGFRETELDGIPLLVARSGWSKQGGFELYLKDASQGTALWERVRAAGVPYDIGPGAPNDAERIESGLISYGADLRRQTLPATPFELGLERLVSLDAPIDFVGRRALERLQAAGARRRRTGVLVAGDGATANAAPVPLWQGEKEVGIVSEIVWSPRLARCIGVGLVSSDLPEDARGLAICLEGAERPVSLARLPFIGGA
ncbi:MAG: glycine cleavage T C-terminal barrel domain-containing protein [Pseudomonadota bacterium]